MIPNNKVRLSTRLILLLITVTALVAFSVGWLAISVSSRSEIATIDASINAVINSGTNNQINALENAINTVQENNYNLTLDVISSSGFVTQVVAGAHELRSTPTLSNVSSSHRSVTTAKNLPGFRFKSLPIGGGDYLLVAASTSQVDAANQRLVRDVVLTALLVAFLVIFISRFLLKRSLRTIHQLIAYASSISKNDFNVSPPENSSVPELSDLQASLSSMVTSLQRTINSEKNTNIVMQRFVGDASHELRTPLTVIKGYSEMLQRGDLTDDQQHRAAQKVQHEVDRMDSLIGDLLFLAELNEVPIASLQVCNISQLVTNIIYDFGVDNPSRTLTTSIDEDIHVRATDDLIYRILNNALTNIKRYTSESSSVNIELASDASTATLRIEDSGPGLSGEYGVAPKRFARGEDSRSRETGGSGLGMSIMADVASSLGGTMTTYKCSLGGLGLEFSLPVVTELR